MTNTYNYESRMKASLTLIRSYLDEKPETKESKDMESALSNLDDDNRHMRTLELEQLANYARAMHFLNDSSDNLVNMRELLAKHYSDKFDPIKVIDPKQYDNVQICEMFADKMFRASRKKIEFNENYCEY